MEVKARTEVVTPEVKAEYNSARDTRNAPPLYIAGGCARVFRSKTVWNVYGFSLIGDANGYFSNQFLDLWKSNGD